MNPAKSVLILGGGVGGVVAATTLRKRLPDSHRIVLVDRQPDHLFAPSLLWLMTGTRKPRQVARPLNRLSRKGIEVIRGEVAAIDAPARSVRIVGGSSNGNGIGRVEREIAADYLVISLGADLAPEAVPGMAEAGHNFYTLAGAQHLFEALKRFTGGRIVVLTAAPGYKCPAAPYEAALLLDDYARKREIREGTQIDVYAAEPGPMGVAGPEVSAGVRQMIEQRGIGYHPEHQVTGVDPVSQTITFANNTSASFDLLAYVAPHRAPQVVRDAGLTDESGWVPVDRDTLETEVTGVYAIGDVTQIPLVMGKPLPRAGVFAERQAEVVAHNIAREITGEGEPAWFDGHGECFIEIGAGKAGFGKGDFYAEPSPDVKLYQPSRRWHLAKVAFEKMWFRRWL